MHNNILFTLLNAHDVKSASSEIADRYHQLYSNWIPATWHWCRYGTLNNFRLSQIARPLDNIFCQRECSKYCQRNSYIEATFWWPIAAYPELQLRLSTVRRQRILCDTANNVLYLGWPTRDYFQCILFILMIVHFQLQCKIHLSSLILNRWNNHYYYLLLTNYSW